jgi:hypothetical protein
LPGVLLPTHNFCFLEDHQITTIRENVSKVYEELENKYGSIGVVTEQYEDLRKDKEFTKMFPYPQAFFIALRQLQRMEAPQEGSLFFAESVTSLVNAAMVIGYYALFDRDTLIGMQKQRFPVCNLDSPFLAGIDRTSTCSGEFCTRRIDGAQRQLESQSDGTESLRALYVSGAFDGIHRWMFRILDEYGKSGESGCLTGETIQRFAQDTNPRYRILRKQARKIGLTPEDRLCPWNPAGVTHPVQTLVLRGGADAVIAGCQAEDFYNHGLPEGKRVLIEFPGMGHVPFLRKKGSLQSEVETVWEKAYRNLLEKFLMSPVSEYRESIKDDLTDLKAIDRTPEPGVPAKCREMDAADG